MAESGLQINNPFIPNCKVVTQRPSGQLDFGIVTLCSDGQSLKILWESGRIQKLNNELETTHKSIGVYDRALTIGARVRHLGKEGRVCSSNRVITAIFADPIGPGGRIIFPNLRESNLYRILECKVGGLVMHNGWVGLVTKGIVDVTYEFESGVKLLVEQDLESIQGFYYPGKYLNKLPSDSLQRGKWSGGLKYYNLLKYRNKPVKIINLEIVSLSIFWIDRTKRTAESFVEPQQEIRGKQNLASVFGLEDPTKEKFKKNEILRLRWDDNLSQNYQNWQERFVSKYILGREETGDDEPFFKRAKETFPYTNRDRLSVKVLFTQTEVEIMFEDESTATMMAADITEILPPLSKKPSFPDKNYLIGDVVKDKMDFFHPNKYGFILSQNNRKRTCQVKWVIVHRDKSVSFQTTEVSQYDIITFSQYKLLKNSPQVVLAKGIFEGVITGLSLFEGKVKVQCAEGPVKSFHPHELEFCTKKVFISPVDQSYTIRSIQVQTDTAPSSLYYMKNTASAVLHRSNTSCPGQIAKVSVSPEVPMDHSFWNSSYSMFLHPDIPKNLAKDLFEIVTLPNFDIWIQRFENRPDLLTAAIVGPPETIYKEILFFVDMLIPVDYPNCLPQVVIKLPRIYNPEWVNPYIQNDGRLRIPNEVLPTFPSYESVITKTFKFILRNVLCSEPYLSSVGVSSNVFENNNNRLDPDVLRELKKSRDFNESGIVVISEYVHALLCQPPSTWKQVVENYFHEYLPRICWRFTQYLEKPEEVLGDNLISLNERIGSGFLIYPTSKSFKLAMNSRLDNLKPFLDSIK